MKWLPWRCSGCRRLKWTPRTPTMEVNVSLVSGKKYTYRVCGVQCAEHIMDRVGV